MLKIGVGNHELIETFNVKKRPYIGTTSMDSELSLFIANQALSNPGKIILDPFVGTGSLILTCSSFGAFTFGTDIDKRTFWSSENQIGVTTNFKHHQISNQLIDLVVMDSARPAWRNIELFDAIVSDRKLREFFSFKKI